MKCSDYPNIILIIIDAARADHFSCYGYHKNTTPFISNIAKESVLYENAVSPAGWTLPSHSSLFTGTYPSKHGAHNENWYLSDKLPTLAEALSELGYRTAGFCRSDWVSESTGLIRGFDEFYHLHFAKTKHKILRLVNNSIIRGSDKWSYEKNKRIKKWIKHTNLGSSPFFLFVHYSELHMPYHVPKPYNKMFLSLPYDEARKINQNPKEYYSGRIKMSSKDFDILKEVYDCALAYQDARIGELYQFLKNVHLLDNTVLIITSDHGESLGDHNHFDHYYVLYDCLLKVPLIVRYPKLFKRGERNQSLVQTLDIFPTILRILGANEKNYEEIQGIALPPLCNEEVREFTISERFQDMQGLKNSYPKLDLSHLEEFEKDRKTAIRTKEFKLISSMRGNSELFNILKDPNETSNIIRKRKDICKDMTDKLNKWKSSFTPAEVLGIQPEFDDEVVKRLKSLGYLG